MALIIISALAVSYCCVFLLKKTKQKIAVLFAVDALVLAALFIAGARAGETAVFILSAAAANVTVFFMPEEQNLPVMNLKDFAIIGVNIAAAILAAVFMLRNPEQNAGHAVSINPAVTVFLFMALSVTGYFMAAAGKREDKK